MEVWFESICFKVAPGLRRSGPVVFHAPNETIEIGVLGSSHAGLLEAERRMLRRVSAGIGPMPRIDERFDFRFAGLDAGAVVARSTVAGTERTQVVAIAPTAWGVSMRVAYQGLGAWRDVVAFVRSVGELACFPPNPMPVVPGARGWLTGLVNTILPCEFVPAAEAAFEEPRTGIRLEVAVAPAIALATQGDHEVPRFGIGWADELEELGLEDRSCQPDGRERWRELRLVRKQVVRRSDGPALEAMPEQLIDARELRWRVADLSVRAAAHAPRASRGDLDAAWVVLLGSLAALTSTAGQPVWQPYLRGDLDRADAGAA